MILAEALDVQLIGLTGETRLDDIKNLDSFQVIMLFMAIEETFGIQFTMDEIATMKTIGDILNWISGKLNR